MWNLILPVKQCFGDKYANEFEEMVKLNACAMFSSCTFAEEDREKALTFYHETLQHLKANKKWHERLWMQWILCLY